ncbi:MAG: signal peptidase I [Ruminococcaceae bacterium]|nr:signal peptidase I [Oscillospiraceae bacterium]
MKKSMRKIWNITSAVMVALMIFCALFLMGARLLGYRCFTVLTGSMEPAYQVGDLIYVKEVDVNTVQVGDDITFILNEDLVVATHRVVRIDAEKQHFYTKGLANEIEDGDPVHFNNVIGVPRFRIPKLGYVSDFVQNPPGMYIAVAGLAVLLMLAFLPDFRIGRRVKTAPAAERCDAEAENARLMTEPDEMRAQIQQET